MDSILFYGDRGDASRRQVRSAAAQHSHRIGPRKPKASKKPRVDSHQNHRSLKANALPNATIATAAAVGQAGKLAAAPASAPLPLAGVPGPPPRGAPIAIAEGSTPPNFTPMHRQIDSPAYIIPLKLEGTDKELKRQAAQARFQEIQAIQQQQARPELDIQHYQPQQRPLLQNPPADPKPPRMRVPAAPSLIIERIERPQQDHPTSTHSRTNSQASPQSPSTRLPQYSWTEYPRYGLGHNGVQSSLQMLAQVAVAERDAFAPTPASHDVPGFRQYTAEAQMQQPPSSQPQPPSQSSSFQALPLPAAHTAAPQHLAAGLPEPGPQLPPLAAHSLPSQPVLNATFGQFLQSALNGQEPMDGLRRRQSDNSDEGQGDEKPYFSPG